MPQFIDSLHNLIRRSSGGIAGLLNLYPGTAPSASLTAYTLWVDNNGDLQCLLPNANPDTKLNYQSVLDDGSGNVDISGVLTISGIGDGVLTNYDLKVGDTITPDYGMVQIGHGALGITSYNVANVDLDGTFVFRNIGGPLTGLIEFIWEEGSGATRFAMPSSGIGNATFNARSMLNAGPAPADAAMVTVGYWQSQGIFDNLVCDTDGSGADLGVQNDLEVEGDMFTDSIKESTPGAGITLQPLTDSTTFFRVLDTDGGTPILNIDSTNERVGIGTSVPTSSLQVIGLPIYADNAAAITGGLTVGAFYHNNGDPSTVCVVK